MSDKKKVDPDTTFDATIPEIKTTFEEKVKSERNPHEALLKDVYRVLWIVSHKFLKPCPTKFDVGNVMKEIGKVLGEKVIEEMEKHWS